MTKIKLVTAYCFTISINPVIYFLAISPNLDFLELSNESLYLHVFSHLKKFYPSQITYSIMIQTIWPFKKSYEVTLLSKSYRIALKFSKMLSLYCKTIELKTFNLDLLSLISNNSPNLYSVICSKMNMIPITNVILLHNKVRSHKFMFVWKLLAFIAKRFYNPIFHVLGKVWIITHKITRPK